MMQVSSQSMEMSSTGYLPISSVLGLEGEHREGRRLGWLAERDPTKSLCAYKFDLSKAYDRVDWGFLEQVMQKLSFSRVGWTG